MLDPTSDVFAEKLPLRLEARGVKLEEPPAGQPMAALAITDEPLPSAPAIPGSILKTAVTFIACKLFLNFAQNSHFLITHEQIERALSLVMADVLTRDSAVIDANNGQLDAVTTDMTKKKYSSSLFFISLRQFSKELGKSRLRVLFSGL